MNNDKRTRFGPVPVKEGQEYDVEIEGIGEKGDGIAKIEGYVVIVPNVKKGDTVRVKINAVRGRVSFGEVIGQASGKKKEAKPMAEDEDPESDMDDGEETGDE